jgi:mannose-6-phosphate isomerase-like protein (cupin superfamily)
MKRLDEAGLHRVREERATYLENIRVPSLSVGTYSIPPGGQDPQGPHTEDEIYVVTSGSATLWSPDLELSVVAGDVVFVPAGEPHRFVEVSGAFTTLVLFAPAEHTNDPSGPSHGDTEELP